MKVTAGALSAPVFFGISVGVDYTHRESTVRGSPEDKARRALAERQRRAEMRAAGIKVERSDEQRARHAEQERERRKTEPVRDYDREYKRKYREANREYFRTKGREHQRKRRAKLKELGLTDPHAMTPEWQREYRERNRAHLAFTARERKYGLPVEELKAMLAAQDGKCANHACLAVLAGRTMQLDHCHTTNRVRAFLCGPCNAALGRMDDDVEKIRGLADYAERQHAIEAGLPNS